MRGIDFPEANKRLLPPEGEEDSVYTLHVWSDNTRCISKWKLTWRERLTLLFTGVLWFDCWGSTHPPINLLVKYPFERGPRRGWVLTIMALVAWAILILLVLGIMWAFGVFNNAN